MQHPNQILSKETLIDHVWDFDADILPNNVEAYIKNLRQKIDKPFKKQLIKPCAASDIGLNHENFYFSNN